MPRYRIDYFARKASTAAFHSSALETFTPCGAPLITTS